MKWAVILAEDANFYKHEGFDVKAIKNAIKYDLEKKSLKRGASTITQQTAKNLFLSREKTDHPQAEGDLPGLAHGAGTDQGAHHRILPERRRTGPDGLRYRPRRQYYFGKPASALTPRECAFLAAMLPGPRLAYNPYKNLGKVLKRSDMILRLLRRRVCLGESEYQAAMASELNIAGLQRKVDQSVNQPPVFPRHRPPERKQTRQTDPRASRRSGKPMTGDAGRKPEAPPDTCHGANRPEKH